MINIKLIPNEFKRSGYIHSLIKRKNNIVMYEMKDKNNEISGYEVHKVRVKKELTKIINGKIIKFPKREVLTQTNEFGKYGWYYIEKRNAMNKFDELIIQNEKR